VATLTVPRPTINPDHKDPITPTQLVFHYAHRYLGPLLITVITMFLLVAAQLVIPWIVKVLIAAVSEEPLSSDTFVLVSRLTLLALGIYILRGGLQFLRSYMAHVAGWGVVADLRKHIYEHMQRLTLRFYEDKQTGQMMSRVINDTDLFERLIAHAVPDVLVNAITLIAISAVLISMNWQLALLSMLPIPLVIASLRVFARFVRPAFRTRQKELGDLNAILNDNLSGIREIKAFTREEAELERVGSGIDRYRISLLSALRLMAIYQPFIDFTSSLGLLVVIFFGGRMAYQGLLSIADLVAFFLYLEMFYQPVRSLGGAWESVQESLAGADRVTELLQEEPEILTASDAVAIPGRAKGHIVFDNVSFQYSQGDVVLDNISLDIPERHVVALVGPTGVGKSTMVSLIPRFYDIGSGRITLDGRNVCDVTLDSLRQQISIVLQDVFLFHGNVRDNILFGRPNATEEEMIEAAKVANAHEFIMALPDGYETMIGERGVKLSGGQKQRISIARAVLKDAPILILDEATSSVDTETELLIQQALERLMKGRTTIIIAHRLSTIRNANKIVVLEGKRIVEMGNHDDLLEQDGLYKRLYMVQQKFQPEQ
jgi:ATP-binding cassette subfamily B protein/subfamily B ATP-binding cassette protein MsbA